MVIPVESHGIRRASGWLPTSFRAASPNDPPAGAVTELQRLLHEAIGEHDEDEGLEHWHYARSGRTPGSEVERAGVFVDRQQVLDAIDAVLAAQTPETA